MANEDEEHSREQALIDLHRDRRTLYAILASTPEARLLNAVWACRSLQGGSPESASNIIRNAPRDAIGAGMGDKLAIYPWELELLINERLAIDPAALYQSVAPEDWNHLANLVNLVRSVENNESVEFRDESLPFDILYRIGNRQFEWQSGFLTKQEIFRSVFIYGQGECAKYFEDQYRLNINQFSATCFSLFSLYQSFPNVYRDVNLSLIGIDQDTIEKVLERIAVPLRSAKKLARSERNINAEIAYKPSIIRRFPLIGVSARSYRLCCPLPELLINRMTNGLFYDVVGGGGAVRDEFGKRFETYLKMYFEEYLPSLRCESEITFATKDGDRKSTDLLISGSGSGISLLIECKASRLSYKARYAGFDEADRGYSEMIKGITQVWRFVSDVRRGFVDRKISDDAVGAIVTLDSWFVAAPYRQKAVIDAAKSKVKDDSTILVEDQIPIAFAYMPELERGFAFCDKTALLSAFQTLATDDRRGYTFDFAIREAGADDSTFRPFAFEDRMSEVLPWWRELDDLGRARS